MLSNDVIMIDIALYSLRKSKHLNVVSDYLPPDPLNRHLYYGGRGERARTIARMLDG